MKRIIIEGKLATFNMSTRGGHIDLTADSGRGWLFLSMRRRDQDWTQDLINATGSAAAPFSLNDVEGEFVTDPIVIYDPVDGRCRLSHDLIFDYECEDQYIDIPRKHRITAHVDLKNNMVCVTEEVTP